MNSVHLIGRLTKDPDVRYTQEGTAVARYTLAIDRRTKEKATDFISCVAFGKNGEFVDRYLRQGTKIAVEGRIQTGSYTNKDGQKVYTTDVVAERHEFCEKMSDSSPRPSDSVSNDGFEAIPETAEADGLPWN